MSGDTRTGRSDLGDTESRIRRILNLEGLVPTDWSGQVLPVMVVGDGMLPGYGSGRTRRWALNFITGPAGADRWITVDADMIVDRVTVVPFGGPATAQVFYQGPNDASPGALAGRAAPFIDRSATSQELAPVRDGSLGVAGGSAIFSTNTGTLIVNVLHEILRTPFFLVGPNVPGQDGSRLRFVTSANAQWNIEGRTF